MNSEDFDREFDLEKSNDPYRSLRLKAAILDIFEKNAELLDRLKDYDENEIPYWENWHMTDCECRKLKCKLCHPEIGE